MRDTSSLPRQGIFTPVQQSVLFFHIAIKAINPVELEAGPRSGRLLKAGGPSSPSSLLHARNRQFALPEHDLHEQRIDLEEQPPQF
jgi:hypothetical protein